jgi:lysophospholipase L1-like esterase
VAFGDSVTHGAVGQGEMDYENVYWNRLKRKIYAKRAYMPVNVINAGIGGDTASRAVARMEKQVLAHNPDLVIVSFGLNDVNGELQDFLNGLREIFSRLQEKDIPVIFMTPNMLNTYVADDTPAQYRDYAFKTAEIQNSGKMDRYIHAAAELATDMGITLCDCYSQWKKLSQTQDTTLLLANRINHPTSDMHNLFADALYDIIMGSAQIETDSESSMFKES